MLQSPLLPRIEDTPLISGPLATAQSHQWHPQSRVRSLTSSVSYMVRLEEKGEGSGCWSSHGLSVDSSRSRPFSEAVSHCVPLDWGFRVTTTLPGHRPIGALPPAPTDLSSPAVPSSSPLTEVESTWPQCSWDPELWRPAGRGLVASLHLRRFLEGTERTRSHCCLFPFPHHCSPRVTSVSLG